jgi:chaperonin cofactor prefoldin
MSTKKIFKLKMETEIARVQSELEKFRIRGMAFTAGAKDKHDEHVAELERKLDATKVRLRELDSAEEHVWENLKDGVEDIWGALQAALQDAVENFKGEPPVVKTYGSDEGAYPYAEDFEGQTTEKAK